MAIQANQPGIEEEKDKETAAIGAPAPSLGGGTAPGTGGVGSAAAQTPGAIGGGDKPATSSGSFTDVGKYLKANKPSIGKYAGNIAGKVAGQVSEAGQAVAEEAKGIQEQIDASRLPGQEFYKGKDVTNIDASKSQNLLYGPNTTPTPESIALANIAGVGKASDIANLSSSFSGSKELIGETMRPETGRYSSGMKSLGAASLQGDSNAREILAKSRYDAKAALRDAEQSQSSLRTNAENAAKINAANRANYANWLEGQASDILDNPEAASSARQQAMYDTLAGEVDRIRQTYDSADRGTLSQREADLISNYNSLTRELDPNFTADPVEVKKQVLQRIAEDTYGKANIPGLTSGYSAADMGKLNAINNLIAGGSGELASRINAGVAQGGYDEAASQQKLLDWLLAGEKIGGRVGQASNNTVSV